MSEVLRTALERVAMELGHTDLDFTLERPRDPARGDFATNLAMQLARTERSRPRLMAERVVSMLVLPEGMLAATEIAGPGFINFRLAADALVGDLRRVLTEGDDYGRSTAPDRLTINVEFVSANPTGPLHVGHGRGAAVGDAVATLLEWTGHDVVREFYLNDAGVQIDRVAASLLARVLQEAGDGDAAVPEGGYHGEYLVTAARDLLDYHPEVPRLPRDDALARCRAFVLADQRREQDEAMALFGVRFDRYTSEQSIYDRGGVAAALERISKAGLSHEHEGALWLRTSEHGDEKDRVLRKSDGSYTYFVPDIAYHLDKARRGFDRAIDVWGADHHGYIPRMRAALAALDLPADWFEVLLVQLVKVVRGGEEVKMSKRSGEFVTLRDLVEETGTDAARYWFLMRRSESHLTFDIELATAHTDDNPVYYVQMAHARMSGILRQATDAAIDSDSFDLDVLTPQDRELIQALTAFPDAVARAARDREPHQVTVFLEDLARLVHGWYHGCRVIGEPAAVEASRLLLARAARQVLANGLTLLGVSAPDRM